MKHLFYLTLVLVFSLTANAAGRKLGSKCGLLDTNDTDGWKYTTVLRLDSDTIRKQVRKLHTLTKQQVIITAKYFASQDDEAPEITNTINAVNYLSRSEGINVNDAVVNGKNVTEVTYYPGDNAYSVIFLAGTTHVLAYGEDGTVHCK